MSTETEIKERPILFSAPMVQAILDGRKTQTRRVVKPPKKWNADMSRAYPDLLYGVTPGMHVPCDYIGEENWERLRNPWGWPQADWDLNPIPVRLWVRETFAFEIDADRYKPTDVSSCVWYAADGAEGKPQIAGAFPVGQPRGKWRPSIHMPRVASRITLEITGVRVERLQCITNADALAEGCVAGERASESDAFHNLWASVYGDASWDANPWVWVVEFKRLAEK